MDKLLYWFLAPGERDAFGELPATELALSIPWWPEAVKSAHGKENERVYAPMVFTTREGAEAKLREFEASEAEAFLGLVEEHGEEDVNEALDNTLPTQVYEISKDTLVSKLEDSDFLCVAVDGRLKLRQNFVEELRKQPEKRGEE